MSGSVGDILSSIFNAIIRISPNIPRTYNLINLACNTVYHIEKKSFCQYKVCFYPRDIYRRSPYSYLSCWWFSPQILWWNRLNISLICFRSSSAPINSPLCHVPSAQFWKQVIIKMNLFVVETIIVGLLWHGLLLVASLNSCTFYYD